MRGPQHRFCTPLCHRTPAQKAASRGRPLAAAHQIRFLELQTFEDCLDLRRGFQALDILLNRFARLALLELLGHLFSGRNRLRLLRLIDLDQNV